jgi:NADPH:quinone reductase-like Zn-dependent oxidoreductase
LAGRIVRGQRSAKVYLFHKAMALCDVKQSQSPYRDGKVCLPFVHGCIFVGTVNTSSPSAFAAGIAKGARVASIIAVDSVSKSISTTATNVCMVAEHLDAADVAAMVAFYLPAFCALHHGRGPSYRYSRTSLKGRRILLTGGDRMDVQAIVGVAHLAGATEIFMTAPRQHVDALKKLKVTLLSNNPHKWLPLVEGTIDVVIDYEFPNNLSFLRKALERKGRMVCVPPPTSLPDNNWLSTISSAINQYHLSTVKRATMFNLQESFQSQPQEVYRDLDFLFDALSTRQLRPLIDRYIRLHDVPATLEGLKASPAVGAVICEPHK